jgi:hypothetical protein
MEGGEMFLTWWHQRKIRRADTEIIRCKGLMDVAADADTEDSDEIYKKALKRLRRVTVCRSGYVVKLNKSVR